MDDNMSSPDPLNDSPIFQSPRRARRSSHNNNSFPLQGSSPKKQTFQLDIGHRLSPQKILVTVEAGNSDVENAYFETSPSPHRINRRRERITTTTIPVKGLSDSENEIQTRTPKKGRGRPRKSSGTPVPGNKRAGTPSKKGNRGRKSFGSLVDGDDTEDIDFRIGQSIEVVRGKRGSRSRSAKRDAQKIAPGEGQTETQFQPIANTTSKKGRDRRKTLGPDNVIILEDPMDESHHHVHSEKEIAISSNALEAIHINSQASSRPYNIRSTSNIAEGAPDVPLARFVSVDNGAHELGWPKPDISLAARYSSGDAMSASDPYIGHDDEPSAPMVQESELPAPEEDEEVECDDAADYRELDTMLESEGFSMISVDSVPSLRQHHSTPPSTETKMISCARSGNPSPGHETQPVSQNDCIAGTSFKDFNATTSAIKAQNNRSLRLQVSRAEDSFSSIAPDILQAATPARRTLLAKTLSRNNSHLDDSFSSIAPEILDAATPAHKSSNRSLLMSIQTRLNVNYEDSFSAVSPSVLHAATPAGIQETRSPIYKPNALTYPLLIPEPRLPTPEDTPSPPNEPAVSKDSNNNIGTKNTELQSTSAGQPPNIDSSLVHTHLPSSPPSLAPHRYTYTAHIRQRRLLNPDVTQTPSIIFSSPSLPPPIRPARANPKLSAVPEQSQRPALSPIVRAGQALQGVVVPSSPRSRSQSLGSPFKSPLAERGSDLMSQQSPLHDRLGTLPKFDLNRHFSDCPSQQSESSSHQEDPFNNNGPERRKCPSSEDIQRYNLDLPASRRLLNPQLAIHQSEAEIRSEDAMSWQEEEEISVGVKSSDVDGAVLSTNQGMSGLAKHATTWEQRSVIEKAEICKQAGNTDLGNIIVIHSDEESQHGEEDSEDFGLLLETLNSSSPAASKPLELTRDISEKPRRSKIPSPWRNDSKGIVYNDEPSSSFATNKVTLLSQMVRGSDAEPVTVRRIVAQQISDDESMDFSDYQIPQKSNFDPRSRESIDPDLSALLAISPGKRLPVLSTSSRSTSSHVATLEEPVTANTFARIPQKAGFAPRARADLSSSSAKLPLFLPTVFNGSTDESFSRSPPHSKTVDVLATNPLSDMSTSKTNIVHNYGVSDLRSSSLSSSEISHPFSVCNGEKENEISNSRTLKWTECLRLQPTTEVSVKITQPILGSVSPTKSILRSPLKTPSAGTSPNSGSSPMKGVKFVSSSPMPANPTQALSGTQWSKEHWRLLDSITQTWKPDNQSSPSSSGSETTSEMKGDDGLGYKRRRNSTRVISKLLGKTVRSQGEQLRLQQWHLEVVDEFRGQIPGWKEEVVAMRVFALVVGEQRRKSGLVGGRTADGWPV